MHARGVCMRAQCAQLCFAGLGGRLLEVEGVGGSGVLSFL